MLVIVGALIVLGSVMGGFLWAGGPPMVLVQPSEFLIIGGAALGALVIGTPLPVIRKLAGGIGGFFRAPRSKEDYLELLGMLHQLFKVTQQAGVMGLEKDMVCVMIHSGSRGLGYQVCDDALAMLRKAPDKYGIALPDRQLACAPVNSPEGQHYIGAMRAAANFAWCNRQLLMQQAREVFAAVFGRPW